MRNRPETAPVTALVSRELTPRGTTRVTTTLASVVSTIATPTTKPSQATTLICTLPRTGRMPPRLRLHSAPAACGTSLDRVVRLATLGVGQLSILRYIADNWDSLGPQVATHLEIVGLAMGAAAVLGLLLGVASARWERLAAIILAIASTLLTVPSFALFGLLTIWFGLGTPPVIAGLILYALL